MCFLWDIALKALDTEVRHPGEGSGVGIHAERGAGMGGEQEKRRVVLIRPFLLLRVLGIHDGDSIYQRILHQVEPAAFCEGGRVRVALHGTSPSSFGQSPPKSRFRPASHSTRTAFAQGQTASRDCVPTFNEIGGYRSFMWGGKCNVQASPLFRRLPIS